MRLWHYKLIPFLPKSQLVSQWRELNSIFTKQDNHILINYIYDYDKKYLYNYSMLVINEMKRRKYKINKWDNFNTYFKDADKVLDSSLSYKEHDMRYLDICYFNLYEKYLRGQKDFSDSQWYLINYFYRKERFNKDG